MCLDQVAKLGVSIEAPRMHCWEWTLLTGRRNLGQNDANLTLVIFALTSMTTRRLNAGGPCQLPKRR